MTDEQRMSRTRDRLTRLSELAEEAGRLLEEWADDAERILLQATIDIVDKNHRRPGHPLAPYAEEIAAADDARARLAALGDDPPV